MTLNPFDMQLEDALIRASEFDSNLKTIRNEINWYENTEPNTLADFRHELNNKLEICSHDYTRLQSKVRQIEVNIKKLSESINSLWNPANWFNSEQQELRGRAAEKKELLDTATKNAAAAQGQLQDLRQQIYDNAEDIEKYYSFDFDEQSKKRISLANQVARQKRVVEQLANLKQGVDAALAPIVKQIREAEHKKSLAASAKSQAQRLDAELSNADNSYERAMAHKSCEEKFGTGSPKKVISQKDSEIRRLDRDLEKLQKRAKTVADKAARNIKKLIFDGNNLCYQSGVFIGLSALKPVMSTLSNDYDVVLVFDASIRKLLKCSDSDIRDELGSNIQVHVVATSVKADETVLDLCGADKTTFIVSNDRFAEYGEKQAILDQRVIRHEIVSGQVLIHDLGVSEMFSQ
jgi:archaellum component FlaC